MTGNHFVPDSFYTFDQVLFAFDTTTVRTTDSHSGQFAALLQNVQFGSVLPGQLTYGSYQSIGPTNYFYGWPFTSLPNSLKFWYQFLPSGSDSATVIINLSRSGNSVGGGIMFITSSTSNYIEGTLPITYTSSLTPDSIYVSFLSSGLSFSGNAGTEFYVDDISLDYSTSVNELDLTNTVKAYPNPVTNTLTIETTHDGSSELILYDPSSRIIYQQMFNRAVYINTEHLAKGIYIYEVRTRRGKIEKGKVVKD